MPLLRIEEEEERLRLLKLPDCYYFGLHPSNVVPMHGNLTEDRDEMLQEIERKRKQLGSRLADRPVRISEGAIFKGDSGSFGQDSSRKKLSERQIEQSQASIIQGG